MIRPLPFFDPLTFSTELIFTIIAIAFCFAIYFKTKETYELTRYEGVRYFRNAFFFFGLSYAMRFLFSFLLFSRMAFDLILLPRALFLPLFILPLGYFSTMGLFYLIFSLIWKRFDNKSLLLLGHGVAILLSILSFATRSHLILLLLQSILLIIAVLLSFFVRQGKKKLSQTKILYLLILVFWLIDLWIIDRRSPFSMGIQLLSYLISLIIFIVIYHKVSKWVK